ncbi:App1 family protein [Paenarthrobacter sp. Z7-10]|uniref:App1 family protein n=1 Tax=Paenarthrobacter sp. Z7-10 TaxID=2787635 RepID=UPI0022A8F53B|nr:phosphatase domain-containing protein [Paenarthrobacter sp. Z7-10]
MHGLRTRLAKHWNSVPQVVAYPSYGTTTRMRVLGRVLLATQPVSGSRAERAAKSGNQNIRGWRAFLGVPIQNADVEIEVGGVVHRVQADLGGLVDTVVDVQLEPGWHTAALSAAGTEPAQARIFIADPDTSFGIVCDIDDTIMVTALPRPFLALWNTFVLSERARTPTPGMAVLMDRLAIEHPDAPVIYLSTGPWNAAPTLERFLGRNMYPSGALLLTDWGLTQERWFRSGIEHKRSNLERLAREFPSIRWLLIGDNGQHDEKIYTEFSRLHPENVAAVAIRQLSPGEAVLAGGTSHDGGASSATDGGAAGGEPATIRFAYAPDGASLAKQLRQAGVI